MEENDGMEGKVKEKRKKGWKSEEQEREKRETSIYSTGLYLRASLVTLSLSPSLPSTPIPTHSLPNQIWIKFQS